MPIKPGHITALTFRPAFRLLPSLTRLTRPFRCGPLAFSPSSGNLWVVEPALSKDTSSTISSEITSEPRSVCDNSMHSTKTYSPAKHGALSPTRMGSRTHSSLKVLPESSPCDSHRYGTHSPSESPTASDFPLRERESIHRSPRNT